MTESTASEDVTEVDLDDIQGNVVGFSKDHQRLLFIQFPNAATGRAFAAAMAAEVSSARLVRDFNRLRKDFQSHNADPTTLNVSWSNVGLSFAGLHMLGADGADAFPDEFKAGMAARASSVGDVDTSAPTNWVGAFAPNSGFVVHAVVVVAADSPSLLDERTASVRAIITQAGVTEYSTPQDGQTRPGDFRGHEHFGFKDGISQPSVAGLVSSSKGGEEIAVGEFLIGYEDQDGHVSGQPVPAVPPAAAPPAQPPGYLPTTAPSPTAAPLPDWCRNGSFLVYRRLRQDVAGFNNFLTTKVPSSAPSADALGAKLVGRWKSGAPLENVPGDGGVDTTTADPSVANPDVLSDDHINDFGYLEHDADGHLTPRAAHIRKTYPRDSMPPGREESDRHRVLRRGIPYGPEFVPNEPAYGAGAVPDAQDRGLLFLCYQASIARGFEFIQTQWANVPDFPNAGDGEDPIMAQNNAAPPFALNQNTHLTTARWVITTGGEYFFSPSIAGLRHLGDLT